MGLVKAIPHGATFLGALGIEIEVSKAMKPTKSQEIWLKWGLELPFQSGVWPWAGALADLSF